MKKIISLLLVVVMLAAVMAGCGTSSTTPKATSSPAETKEPAKETAAAEPTKAPAQKDVTIKVYQLKVEIADALKKMETVYEKENPGVKLKFETVGGGADYAASLMAKFSSGDAPDVFVNSGYAQLNQYIDKCEELTNETWVKDMVAAAGDPITKDGKLYGQPQAIEGFGFAYNKALFTKAGITTLPNTLSSLEDACKKLQTAGIQPFVNSYAEWWVLGMHNMNIPLSHQADPQKFISDVAAGTQKFKDNAVTADWLKLIDLTVKYGQKNATTAGDYATSVNLFASGKGAMIQQGNWIQPDLDKADPNLDVGFLPMPINDTAEEKINAGIPNFWCINKASKVKDDAKAWLAWMTSSDSGKNFVTEDLKFVPAFKSIQAKNIKGLNKALSEYASAGKIYGWSFPRLPDGSHQLIGASMMKYIAKQLDSTKLCSEIDKAIIDKTKK